jgi:hypothetical protein
MLSAVTASWENEYLTTGITERSSSNAPLWYIPETPTAPTRRHTTMCDLFRCRQPAP